MAHASRYSYVREEIGPELRAALAQPHASWADVHRVMAAHDARYETVHRPGPRAGIPGPVQGGRVVGSEVGEYARARDLGPDLTHRKLEERLGAYEPDLQREQTCVPFAERCASAAREVLELQRDGTTRSSWEAAHAVFEKHSVEYQPYRQSGRIIDLDGPTSAKPADVDRGLRFSSMCTHFGVYEPSSVISAGN